MKPPPKIRKMWATQEDGKRDDLCYRTMATHRYECFNTPVLVMTKEQFMEELRQAFDAGEEYGVAQEVGGYRLSLEEYLKRKESELI